MPQTPAPRRPAEDWENEGGSVRPSPEPRHLERFLIEPYSVGDRACGRLADAMAQALRPDNRVAGR